jgi:hypothetical protein
LEENSQYKEYKNRRYHTFSDFNYHKEQYKIYAKVGLLLLVLRELPVKHFYARAFLVGTTITYLWFYHWQYLDAKRFPAYYMTERDQREFDNYPMLNEIVRKKIANKNNNPTMHEADYWWQFQKHSFYMHHFKHYRYIFRHRREVPWDGTFNQPVFPFIVNRDRTAFVSNGTNEQTEPKPNAAW